MRFILSAAVVLLFTSVSARTETDFQNCVSVNEALVLSLGHREDGQSLDELLHERSLESERVFSALVHNTGSDERRLWLFAKDYTFSFQLYDRAGKQVRKTPLGIENSKVPPGSFLRSAEFPRRIIPVPRGGVTVIAELPPLEQYFYLPASGEYILEFRLRYCIMTNGIYSWRFSDRVRLPVMAGTPTVQPGGSPNRRRNE